MNRLAFVRSQPSAVGPMAAWGSGFPIVAGLRRELFKEFARAIWTASRNGSAETHVRNPQSNFPLSHPAPSLSPSAGFACGRPRPPAGRTFIRHGSSSSRRQRLG